MNTKVSVFVICADVVMDLLLYHLHDFTFNAWGNKYLCRYLGARIFTIL